VLGTSGPIKAVSCIRGYSLAGPGGAERGKVPTLENFLGVATKFGKSLDLIARGGTETPNKVIERNCGGKSGKAGKRGFFETTG
jgi:hypothetical protein